MMKFHVVLTQSRIPNKAHRSLRCGLNGQGVFVVMYFWGKTEGGGDVNYHREEHDEMERIWKRMTIASTTKRLL
jgi:hypothetical protein